MFAFDETEVRKQHSNGADVLIRHSGLDPGSKGD